MIDQHQISKSITFQILTIWEHNELYFGKFRPIHVILTVLVPSLAGKGMMSLTLAPSFPAVPSAPFSPMPPWGDTQNVIYSFNCLLLSLEGKLHEGRGLSLLIIVISP